MAQPLSPQLFAILSVLVEERLGLHYASEDGGVFADKIAIRVAEAGFHSALDYYYYLRYDPGSRAELDALADALVVGETYFFRELEPLRVVVEAIIAPVIAKEGRARIWSAGCATGEEPLSLSMLLEEAKLRDRCEIVATDLSSRALRKARDGVYRARSLRVLPPASDPPGMTPALAALAKRFLVRDGAEVRADHALVDAIAYRQLNLCDGDAIASLGSFDVVLCRNVLIYFADPTVKRIVGSFTEALRDEGRLVIGVSESLLRLGTALRCEELRGAFFYAKAAA